MMKSLLGLIVATAMLTSARTQSPDAVPKFVQTGNDLRLDFDAEVPDDFIVLKWKVNNKDIVRYRLKQILEKLVLPEYRDRIEFTDEKYSVILKNLQEADNGVYTAQLTPLEEKAKQLAEYEVKVQDPVSPVNLTVVPVVTNVSCKLAVSCRTTQSPLHVINGSFPRGKWEGKKLSEVTTSGSSLEVYLSSGSIICRHSNDVSQKRDNKTIDGVCPEEPGISAPISSPVVITVSVFFGSLAVLGSVVLVIFLIRRRRRNRITENVENTIYSTPQVVARPPAEKEDDSNSTYCKVGQHLTPVELAAMRPPDVLPESCYATVNKR